MKMEERILRSSNAAKRLREEEKAKKQETEAKRLKLTPITFRGRIVYCTTFIDCAIACDALLESAEASTAEYPIGFDMEWPFSFQTGPGKTALIQICPSKDVCYLLHVSALRTLPQSLVALLNHPKVRLVGVNIRNDVRKLARDFRSVKAEGILNNCVDSGSNQANRLTSATRRWSMAALLETFLYMKINKDKKVRMSKWHVVPLSKEQIKYAAIDAYASLKLYEYFKEMEVKLHAEV